HLFPSHHVAGAHGAFFVFAALAHAHTARGYMREIAVVFRVRKIGFYLRRIVVSSQAQVFIQAVWINLLAWIHLPIRVPYSFELAECLNQLWPEHLDQQLASGLSIAM